MSDDTTRDQPEPSPYFPEPPPYFNDPIVGKREVYDREIAPLVNQILERCLANHIPVHMMFHVHTDANSNETVSSAYLPPKTATRLHLAERVASGDILPFPLDGLGDLLHDLLAADAPPPPKGPHTI